MAKKKTGQARKEEKHTKPTTSSDSIKHSRFSKSQLLTFLVLFAAVGGFIIYKSFAAPAEPPTVSISASPSTIHASPNSYSTLSWSTSGANSCSASGDWSGSEPLNSPPGFLVGPLTVVKTYHFTLTCFNSFGSTPQTASVNATPPIPTVSLSASKTSITAGQSTTLSWSSTNATSCSASWTASHATAGSQAVSPGATTTYSISCSGGGGTSSASRTVSVLPSLSFSTNKTSITKGQSATLTWTVASATSCTASGSWSGSKAASNGAHSETVTPSASSTYNLSCANASGTTQAPSISVSVTGTPPPPPAKPVVRLVASPATVAYNSFTYLQWSSSNASSCSGTWTASHATSGTQKTGNLTSTKTYSITCSGAGGSTTTSTRVAVASANCGSSCPAPTSSTPPPADTTAPTDSTTELLGTTDENTSPSESSDNVSNLQQNQTKKRNHLKDFILGGLIGGLIGFVKN